MLSPCASIVRSKKSKNDYTPMTDNATRFLKRLKGISLSANERLQMRERLTMYTDMHPVMRSVATVPFFTFIASRRFSTYALALVVVLVATTGVSLGAEASVP